jgi:hypothetical protein
MSSYKISKIDPVSIHVPKKITLEEFKFSPHIQVFRGKPGETNRKISLMIVYEILCVFEDKRKEPRRFASTEQEFIVTKNDDEILPYRGEIVFECLKITEGEFESLLRKHNTLQQLRSIGMKKITFESWAKGNPNNGNSSLLN